MADPLIEPIKIAGLREFTKAAKAADETTGPMIKGVLNDGINLVLDHARPRVPSKTGVARGSMKAKSTAREARIVAGGTKAPYYPWLDYGGRVGRGRTGPNTGSVNRPFYGGGRYLYPAYSAVRADVLRVMEKGLKDLGDQIGLEVTDG